MDSPRPPPGPATPPWRVRWLWLVFLVVLVSGHETARRSRQERTVFILLCAGLMNGELAKKPGTTEFIVAGLEATQLPADPMQHPRRVPAGLSP